MKRPVTRFIQAGWLTGVSLIGAALFADSAWAEPPLRKGMLAGEVVKILGAPVERTEFETRREEQWRFEKYTTLFKEGKLVSWKAGGATPLGVLALPDGETPPPVIEEVPKRKIDEAAFPVEEILSEIMKEGPSNEGPEASAPVPPNLPINPMNPLPEASQ